MRGWPLLLVIVGLLATPAASAGAARMPPIDHVFIIVLENKSYKETFGAAARADPARRYLARDLPAMGAHLGDYFGTAHWSHNNYITMVSGQPGNAYNQTDCPVLRPMVPGTLRGDGVARGIGCIFPRAVKTIADQLEARGLTWKAYMEDMANGGPGVAKTCRHPPLGTLDIWQSAVVGDQYVTRHNPFPYFHSLLDDGSCRRFDVDLSQLPRDLRRASTTPNYSFIVPNVCNDGHDEPCVSGQTGGLTQINRYLRVQVPRILNSPAFRRSGLLLITFDEAEYIGPEGDSQSCCGEIPGPNSVSPGWVLPGPGGGRMGSVAISPFIRRGTVTSHDYNHYSQLRTVEDIFGLRHLAWAGRPGVRSFGADVFARRPAFTGSR